MLLGPDSAESRTGGRDWSARGKKTRETLGVGIVRRQRGVEQSRCRQRYPKTMYFITAHNTLWFTSKGCKHPPVQYPAPPVPLTIFPCEMNVPRSYSINYSQLWQIPRMSSIPKYHYVTRHQSRSLFIAPSISIKQVQARAIYQQWTRVI